MQFVESSNISWKGLFQMREFYESTTHAESANLPVKDENVKHKA